MAGNNNKPSRTRGKTARGGVARALAVLLGAAAAGTAGFPALAQAPAQPAAGAAALPQALASVAGWVAERV